MNMPILTDQCETTTVQGSLDNNIPQYKKSTNSLYGDYELPLNVLSRIGFANFENKTASSDGLVKVGHIESTILNRDSISSKFSGSVKSTDGDRNTGQPQETSPYVSEAGEKTKSAHNVIEQRYRNRINEKFQALQISVPTLFVASNRKTGLKTNSLTQGTGLQSNANPSETPIDLEGLIPATKLNKGTILAKTIEYIKFLECKHQNLEAHYQQLSTKAELLGLQVKDVSEKNQAS